MKKKMMYKKKMRSHSLKTTRMFSKDGFRKYLKKIGVDTVRISKEAYIKFTQKINIWLKEQFALAVDVMHSRRGKTLSANDVREALKT